MVRSCKISAPFGFVILLIAVLLSSIAHAQLAPDAGRGTVKVMTYNIFQGTDFTEIMSAQSPADYLKAAQLTLNEVQSIDTTNRMKAIAHQIAITNPDLVGLGEATLWRYGVGPNPTDVLFDPLPKVLDELTAEGLHYSVAIIADEYELQGPMPDLTHFLRANGRSVILARSDEPGLELSNPQTASFQTLLKIPNPILGDIKVVRGWASVDVNFNGQKFEFIDTHLENPIPQIPATYQLQEAQALELLGIAAKTPLPVIVVGDFNAIANQPTDPSNETYQLMLNAGFKDAWAELHPGVAGTTWPLDNSATIDTTTQRIDFVFYRGLVNARAASLAGDVKHDKVDGMWPSDHAGLRALLQIGAQ